MDLSGLFQIDTSMLAAGRLTEQANAIDERGSITTVQQIQTCLLELWVDLEFRTRAANVALLAEKICNASNSGKGPGLTAGQIYRR